MMNYGNSARNRISSFGSVQRGLAYTNQQMHVTPIRTRKLIPGKQTLFEALDKHLPDVSEQSIVIVTSKIVSMCEGSVIKIGTVDKAHLIQQESEYFIPPDQSRYHITLTIKNNLLIPTAGIDESNGFGYYVLWPRNPQKTANAVRRYLVNRFSVRHVGVVITDSRTTSLRWGTTGVAIAHSGFSALNDYIGKPDIFGRTLKVTKANVLDGLAAAAVSVMGEGREQTPMAVISDIPFVKFKTKNPAQKELKEFHIAIQDDLYAPLLAAVDWKVGKGESKTWR